VVEVMVLAIEGQEAWHIRFGRILSHLVMDAGAATSHRGRGRPDQCYGVGGEPGRLNR